MSGIHVRRFGDECGSAIVCLHGVTSWGGHFEALADRLAPRYRVVAPDLHGHGDSGREPPWRIGDHLARLEAAIDDDARTWLGHSFGGRLAFSSRRPRQRRERRPARPARPGDPRPAAGRALGGRERPQGAPLPELRRGDRPALRGEPAAPRAADARRGRVAPTPRRGARRVALPLLPGGRRRGVRGDGLATPAIRMVRVRRCSSSESSRTCRTTTCSAPTGKRSATSSRSSRSPAATRCCGTRSTRQPLRSLRSSPGPEPVGPRTARCPAPR